MRIVELHLFNCCPNEVISDIVFAHQNMDS